MVKEEFMAQPQGVVSGLERPEDAVLLESRDIVESNPLESVAPMLGMYRTSHF